MSDFLEQVVRERAADVAALREQTAPDVVERAAAAAGPARSLAGAIRARRVAGRLGVIAEVKRISPALGRLATDLDPSALARSYASAGAAAISVLVEPRHWGGSFDDLAAVREAVDLPLLCKDVIVDPYQLYQARAAGADAVLLIAEALGDRVGAFARRAAAIGLEALVEAHEPAAFEIAVASGAACIGVNARDLRVPARIVPDRIADLASRVPAGAVLVAESGIASVGDLERLPARVDAVLVGTALVRASDPGPLLRSLVEFARTTAVSA